MSNACYFEAYYSAWGSNQDVTPEPVNKNVSRPDKSPHLVGTIPNNNDYRRHHYLSLQKTLSTLSKLSEDNSFYLSPAVTERASRLLGIIYQNVSIDAPKFFPQDGEAVVFTWDDVTVKRFLTVDDEELDLLDMEKTNYVRCRYAMPEAPEDQISFALNELGGATWLNKSTAD